MVDRMEAEAVANGWTFRFTETPVVQVRVDHRFTLLLEGGVQIILEEPFELDRGDGTSRVPAGEADHEVGDALPLLHHRVVLARATSTGDLRIGFDDGAVVRVPVDPHFESWQILRRNGEQWIGAPGGGVTHILPHHPGTAR
jgi:Family of unknown function (DUF6188)